MKVFINKNTEDRYEVNPLLGLTRKHDLPFHLEKDKWSFVNSIAEADIIPLLLTPFDSNEYSFSLEDQLNYLRPIKSNQFIVIMIHTHSSDHFNEDNKNIRLDDWFKHHKNVLTVDINRYTNNHKNHIFYDFMFDLIKAYWTEYEKYDLVHRLWTNPTSQASFKLSEISSVKLTKRFLIPNTIRKSGEFKDYARQKIKDKIILDEDCFYSDLPNGVQLLPEEESLLDCTTPNGAGIIPLANYYYRQSAVSVFTETICTCKHKVKAITEKTFIPLIRGHFILPFGYCGIITDIKEYGFKLPDWIDYDYDSIEDDEERLDKYFHSVQQLRELSLERLSELVNTDIEMLKHNRAIFYTRPYDSLYDKIKQRIENKYE